MEYVLIIDIGTGGIHTCLADTDGRLCANHYSELAYAADAASGGHQFDAEAFFQSVMASMRHSLGAAPAGAEVRGIGVTSQRHGCVLLDGDDKPLNAFPNLDARAGAVIDELRSDAEAIYAATGRWPAPWFPGARLLWYTRQRPEERRRIRRLMMLNEYVIYRLTGAAVSEWSNAAETLLLDINSLAWSDAMRRRCGAEDVALNTVVPTGSVAGLLRPDMAERFGRGRLPVVVCASDTQSATLGCGQVRPGEVAVVNGSTTPLFMPIDAFLTDPEHRVQTDPYYGEAWALEANTNQSGMIYRRLVDQLLALIRRLPGHEAAGRDLVYNLFAGSDCDPQGIVMNWGPLMCNMGKYWSLPKLAISGDSNEENLFLALIPAYVENLAFAIAANIELLSTVAGSAPGRIILTGGGSANRRLQRVLTALHRGRDLVITDDLETTSRGAAIQTWVAAGRYPTVADAFAAMDTSAWCTPLPAAEVAGVDERYRRWREQQQQLLNA